MSESQGKDWWDKLQALGIFIASVLLPVVLVHLGNSHSSTMQQSEQRLNYLKMAVSILREEPKPETAALRDWAIELLDVQSQTVVPLSADAKNELREIRAFGYVDNFVGGDYRDVGGDYGYTYDYGGGDYGYRCEPGSKSCPPKSTAKEGERKPDTVAPK